MIKGLLRWIRRHWSLFLLRKEHRQALSREPSKRSRCLTTQLEMWEESKKQSEGKGCRLVGDGPEGI